jgi:hypothetical protein
MPDMSFYGIHGIEPIYVLMGAGCETVTRVQTKDTDVGSTSPAQFFLRPRLFC